MRKLIIVQFSVLIAVLQNIYFQPESACRSTFDKAKFGIQLAASCQCVPSRVWHVIVNEANVDNFKLVVQFLTLYDLPVRTLIVQSYDAPTCQTTKWTSILKEGQALYHGNANFKDFYYFCMHSAYFNQISLQTLFDKQILGETATQLENLGFQTLMHSPPAEFPPKFFGNTVR